MGRGYFLDRDIIIDKENNVYTVLTNYNPPGYIFAYLKYIYTGKGIWNGYERVLKRYGIHNLIKVKQKFNFESCYDASFPIVNLSNIVKHLKPEEKLQEILSRSINDEILYRLIEIVEKYIRVDKVGVTGSILLNSYHKDSDIDLIIYGCKKTLDFMETFTGFEKDYEWIYEANENYGIDFADILYDNRRRGVYKGKRVSILFVDDRPWKYCSDVCKKVGRIKFRATISGTCEALFYPSIANVISNNIYNVNKVVSYEGIFSSALFGEREVEIEGMLMKCQNENVVIIGDIDVRGYVKPL
ncbi:nucleotidyltransferase domain-containing protein [Sulfolobus tengchongensis]|uniref:Nucleotidyltransferase domain-containing protein n=1 Tax=Sulfolobus tengchongensis TaxID=207809 RepID=A0AAX4L034_9CREN